MVTPDNPLFADEQPTSSAVDKGRRAVLRISIAAISMALLIAAHQVSLGLFRFALVTRVVLLLGVCWGMYRARSWARMAFLFLMLIGVINFGLQAHGDPQQWVYVVAHSCLALTVLMPSSVRAHFAHRSAA